MVSSKLNDWLQVIGLFGVLGGLIFVGLLVRQDRLIANAAGIDAASNNRTVLAQLLTDNADVWYKGLSAEPLSDAEALQFEQLARAYTGDYFRAWVRVRSQIGPRQPLERFPGEFALDLLGHPGLLAYWETQVEQLERVGAGDQEFNDMVRVALDRFRSDNSVH